MRRTITITHDGYDFRVPAPDGTEAGAYYTDNHQDARDTALAMYPYDDELTFRFRRRDDHPGA